MREMALSFQLPDDLHGHLGALAIGQAVLVIMQQLNKPLAGGFQICITV